MFKKVVQRGENEAAALFTILQARIIHVMNAGAGIHE